MTKMSPDALFDSVDEDANGKIDKGEFTKLHAVITKTVHGEMLQILEAKLAADKAKRKRKRLLVITLLLFILFIASAIANLLIVLFVVDENVKTTSRPADGLLAIKDSDSVAAVAIAHQTVPLGLAEFMDHDTLMAIDKLSVRRLERDTEGDGSLIYVTSSYLIRGYRWVERSSAGGSIEFRTDDGGLVVVKNGNAWRIDPHPGLDAPVLPIGICTTNVECARLKLDGVDVEALYAKAHAASPGTFKRALEQSGRRLTQMDGGRFKVEQLSDQDLELRRALEEGGCTDPTEFTGLIDMITAALEEAIEEGLNQPPPPENGIAPETGSGVDDTTGSSRRQLGSHRRQLGSHRRQLASWGATTSKSAVASFQEAFQEQAEASMVQLVFTPTNPEWANFYFIDDAQELLKFDADDVHASKSESFRRFIIPSSEDAYLQLPPISRRYVDEDAFHAVALRDKGAEVPSNMRGSDQCENVVTKGKSIDAKLQTLENGFDAFSETLQAFIDKMGRLVEFRDALQASKDATSTVTTIIKLLKRCPGLIAAAAKIADAAFKRIKPAVNKAFKTINPFVTNKIEDVDDDGEPRAGTRSWNLKLKAENLQEYSSPLNTAIKMARFTMYTYSVKRVALMDKVCANWARDNVCTDNLNQGLSTINSFANSIKNAFEGAALPTIDLSALEDFLDDWGGVITALKFEVIIDFLQPISDFLNKQRNWLGYRFRFKDIFDNWLFDKVSGILNTFMDPLLDPLEKLFDGLVLPKPPLPSIPSVSLDPADVLPTINFYNLGQACIGADLEISSWCSLDLQAGFLKPGINGWNAKLAPLLRTCPRNSGNAMRTFEGAGNVAAAEAWALFAEGGNPFG